jgi:hypothetical protein
MVAVKLPAQLVDELKRHVGQPGLSTMTDVITDAAVRWLGSEEGWW